MCGRFTLFHQGFLDELISLGLLTSDSFIPRYNVSPGQNHWILYKEQATLHLAQGQWGITPSWMKKGQVLFNAKIETVLEKPTFSKAYRMHRCVVPIDGFFEWRLEGNQKQPYWFHRLNEEVFYLGGIYFPDKDGNKFVVLTTQANAFMAPFHSRMPIILTKKSIMDWLSTKALMDREAFFASPPLLQERKVSTKVNHATVEDQTLIKAV